MTELARPLETGWLPDTPIGDSLLRRFVANQADLQDHLVGAVGGHSDRTPGVALSDSGVAAAYLNQAVMLRPISDAHDAVLDQVASFYAGSVGLLLSPWPTPDLAGRGWHLVGHPMFVVAGTGGRACRCAAERRECAACRVGSRPGPRRADRHRRLPDAGARQIAAQPGNGSRPPPEPGPALDRIPRRHPQRGGGESRGIVNLCLAATLPAARRRGVWHGLVAARCAGTPDLPAVAFTSDYSRPGFLRAGFLPITRFTLWLVVA
jgi:hypothetical protein